MFRGITLAFLFVFWSGGATANEIPSNGPSGGSGDIMIDYEFVGCGPMWGYFSREPTEGKCYIEAGSASGEIWTDGCSEITQSVYYGNTGLYPNYYEDDDSTWGQPLYDYEIYHTVVLSLVFGCSSSGANVPYETRENSCEIQVGEDICNECSVDSEGKVTLVDCSNAAKDIFSYLPQTVDPINSLYGGIQFDVDIETEEMCNHPSVTGVNDTELPLPTPPTGAPSAIATEGSTSVDRISSSPGTLTHSIKTELQYSFFPGKAHQPKEAAIAGLINETMHFFDAAFLEHPAFSRGALKDIAFKHISHSYTGGDVFDLTFTADIIVEDTLTVSNHEVADVIAHSDLNKYVGHYVRNSRRDDDHVFQQVHKVKFRGVSKA